MGSDEKPLLCTTIPSSQLSTNSGENSVPRLAMKRPNAMTEISATATAAIVRMLTFADQGPSTPRTFVEPRHEKVIE